MDTIAKIYNASVHDKKTLVEASLKLFEEGGEVAEAVLSLTGANGCAYKGKTPSDIIEECLDVIIIAGSIIHKTVHAVHSEQVGLPPAVMRKLDEKLEKWKEKVTSE